MRVAQISTWETACGIADYTAMLRSALIEQGIGCEVVAIDRAALGQKSMPELRSAILGLAESAADADIVHIQHEFSIFRGRFGWRTSVRFFGMLLDDLRRRALPVVVTFHSEPTAGARQRNMLIQLAHETAKRAMWWAFVARRFRRDRSLAAIVHTRASRSALLGSGIPSGSVRVFRQGVPPPIANSTTGAERRRMKEALGFPPDARVLSIVGFVSEYKGYSTAIPALASLPSEYHLAIVGGTHPFSAERTAERILASVSEHGLERRVHLTGYVTPAQRAEYLAITDFFLAPYDPFPRLSSSAALTWALASGKPIVASRIPAFVELNDDYGCLALVAPGMPDELASRILELDQDADYAKVIAANAARYCAENQWSHSASLHATLYRHMLGDPIPLPSNAPGDRMAVNG